MEISLCLSFLTESSISGIIFSFSFIMLNSSSRSSILSSTPYSNGILSFIVFFIFPSSISKILRNCLYSSLVILSENLLLIYFIGLSASSSALKLFLYVAYRFLKRLNLLICISISCFLCFNVSISLFSFTSTKERFPVSKIYFISSIHSLVFIKFGEIIFNSLAFFIIIFKFVF